VLRANIMSASSVNQNVLLNAEHQIKKTKTLCFVPQAMAITQCARGPRTNEKASVKVKQYGYVE